ISFQHFKGTTPLSYLRTIRLEGVRKVLADETNSLSVAEIARNWGFSHMSRFAAAYYQAFGEMPSETARRHSGDDSQHIPK
ncbi:helix-turn-helix domain-containing protein, partial [Rhizobium leguminosarum]|uniref:helix-turn-helix domain-containing protein n=1 Tax=Rhizobium leguminosarum TaxID=384 RepID=UPI003F9BC9A9